MLVTIEKIIQLKKLKNISVSAGGEKGWYCPAKLLDLTNWPPGFCELRVVMQTETGDVRGRSPQSSVISPSPF